MGDPCERLAMAQRRGLEALFLLRRPEGLVEMGLGRFGASAGSGSVAPKVERSTALPPSSQ